MNRQKTQEVCCWNSEKLVQVTGKRDYLPRVPTASGQPPHSDTHPHTHTGPATQSPSLVEADAEDAGWKLAGVGGRASGEAVAVLRAALEDEEPLVAEHAVWAVVQARKP